MGLFDKKKKVEAEFDSYIQEVRLSGYAPSPPMRADRPERTESAGDMEGPAYGIDRAIALMRQLPRENVDLVVEVVKKTLESTNIKLAAIIQDAARKQQYLEERRDVLKQEIAELEAEITTRKREISALDADHRETVNVKERLLVAERQATEARTPNKPNDAPVKGKAPKPEAVEETK